jgi:outer membrane protein assembly factor BamB
VKRCLMKTVISTVICGLLAMLFVVPRVSAESAKAVLDQEFPTGGVVVLLGSEMGKTAASLADGTKYVIHVLEPNADSVTAARRDLASEGLYGQITVAHFNGSRLPYADNMINLLVAERNTAVPREEILRVLTPLGSAIVNGKKATKPWPDGMDQWSHFLRGPDNNAASVDSEVSRPLSLRWVESKPWGRSHDQLTSLSTMVTAAGIVFYIMDDAPLATIRFDPQWKLVARDAFNGKFLWEKPIKMWINHRRWFRAGPTHLQRRLVASPDGVYATLGVGEPVVKLDTKTGQVLRTYAGTEHAEEIILKDDILYLLIGTSEIDFSIRDRFTTEPRPEPTKERYLAAIDEKSGKELWRINGRDEDYIHPLGYATASGRLFVHSIKGLECFDAKNGESLWQVPRPSLATRPAWATSTLVASEEVVLLSDQPASEASRAKSNIKYAISQQAKANGKCSTTAYDARTGKSLWEAPSAFGYHSPVDTFIINGKVWLGPAFARGYDLKTGEALDPIKSVGAPVGMVHHRCHRNKAVGKYVYTARDGIEVIDTEKGWHSNNSWLRGACSYGVMPANNMLYVPPDACGCHPHVKLKGLNALSSAYPEAVSAKPETPEDRLAKGPAFSRLGDLCSKSRTSAGDDWPTFRGNSLRHGYCDTILPGKPAIAWTTSLGGKLTQPVKAGSMLLVSSVENHTIHALNIADGSTKWSYQTGGRVNSPPSVYRGVVVFGTADGYVHCLEAETGDLAWRFRAAPGTHLITSYSRFESSWPVFGSVLVMGDAFYFAAGRSTYMDGGIHLYKVEPSTGKVLASSIVSHIDPATGKQTGRESRGSFDSAGFLNDIVAGDDNRISIKQMQFDSENLSPIKNAPHLYCTGGMLEDNWYMRMYWHFGTSTGAGYGRWGRSISGSSPSYAGRIMCMDEEKRLFGYGRIGRGPDPSSRIHDSYHMFCASTVVKASSSETIKKKKKGKKGGKSKKPAKRSCIWSKRDFDLVVKAMALTPETIAVVGFPDKRKESANQLSYEDNSAALAAFTGGEASELRLLSTSDGKLIHKLELDVAPVFDGLIAADGSLYLSTREGSLIRFTGSLE